MTTAGIQGIGTYVPPGRLPVSELRRHWPGVAGPGGVTSVSVAGFDEDVVTMGVEASDAVMAVTGIEAGDIDLLLMATCSSPYAEHSAAAEVARALGLAPTAGLVDLAGSVLGGVQAVIAAADAVRAGRVGRALVVVSDCRRGRPGTAVEALGAGSVALVVSRDAPAVIGATSSWRHGVPTRWRPDGANALHHYDDTRYELLGLVVPAVSAALDALDPRPAFTAVGPLDPRSRSTVHRAVGLDGDGSAAEMAVIGDLGSAGPLFALAGHLSSGSGETGACVAVEPGSGAAAFAVHATVAVPAVDRRPASANIDYIEYLQRAGVLEGPVPPAPIVPHAASPGAARDDAGGSLAGSRCVACGSLHVPPRRVCADCGGLDLALERAPREGRVVTFNVQHVVAVHPEPAPVAVGVVRLEGEGGERGGQVSAMFCDSDLGALVVGAPVELVYRRLGTEDGLVKYGWKARAVVVAGTRPPAAAGMGAGR